MLLELIGKLHRAGSAFDVKVDLSGGVVPLDRHLLDVGVEGLKILSMARQYTGLAIITEVMSETDVDLVAEYADIMQVGARSMKNFPCWSGLELVSARCC